MSSRCRNCGGELFYDIASAQVKCKHCDSLFDPDSYVADTAAEEYQDDGQYETTMFVCPSCGAEITTTEFDAVDYCLYCGSFVSLESKLTRIKRPTRIIPFSKTKEDCKKAYRDSLRYKLYAPSEFKDEKFLDGFRGIYVPYWNFNYKFGPKITLTGEKEGERHGDYIKVQEYITKANYSVELDNLVYDASSSFDDEISLRIAPFSKEKMKPFNTSYMFGFYGDVADVNKNVYKADSDEEIKEKIWKDISAQPEAKNAYLPEKPPASMEKDFNMKVKTNLTMLPIWFLTWRKGDRVAYSVVNGETGETYSEIPISIFRYLLLSLVTAVPIFFALNETVTFNVGEMLTVTMLLSMFMIILYVTRLDKIVRRTMHMDDRGFLSTHEEAEEAVKDVSDNFVTEVAQGLWELVKELGFFAIFLPIAIIASPEFSVIGGLIVVLGTPLYTFYRIYYNAKLLNSMSVYLDVLGAVLALFFSMGILIYDPAPDYYYYSAAVACMAGIVWTAIALVLRYNQMLTRPLPHFFRKGAKA